MKKYLLTIMLLCLSFITLAQNDVTKFLGIPVDGTKAEVIRQLKEKEFTSTIFDPEILQGEFNGTPVHIFIATTNNKVSRIMIADKNSVDETDIKIRFNTLCNQFANNARYISPNEDPRIPEEENISYGLIVHNKRYEAIFYQQPTIDTIAMAKDIETRVSSQFTEAELSNPTDEIKNKLQDMALSYAMDILFKKPVWFTISQRGNRYYISMFYDNEYNRANGEDL